MRLIRGVRYDRYLASQGAELRAVFAQLCAGVQAIHDAGLLHRDLKPSNVLVAETADAPAVVILDFGLTSEASRPGATQTIERGVLVGTPAYMAPEQSRGQRATTASDWYAVGVMLFEVLAGCLPFQGGSVEQLVSKQLKPAPPVRSLAKDAPADLAELCDALLSTDPAARPLPQDIHRIAHSDSELRTGPPSPSCRATRGSTSGDSADLDLPSTALPEPFVGRTREIGQLETALGDTNDGKPVFVLVGGPSGIGKTTFVEHFLSSAKSRGDAVVLAGRCYERESVPFKGIDGVIDALSHYLVRLPDADAARLVPRQAQALSRVFPVLGRVQAIASAPQRRGLPSGGVELRYRAFEALKELLAKLAEERPLILSIDDLQWSDRDSARLLKHLLTPPNPPLLLIVAMYRDDEQDAEGLVSMRQALAEPDAQHQIDVRTIELSALSPAESCRLAQQLLSPDDRDRVEQVAREAGGSPFLIGELTRAAHQGESSGDLQNAILGRIASLQEAERAVLHALCVAPRPLAHDIVSRVVAPVLHGGAVSDADVAADLRALISARLLREVAGKGAESTRDRRRVAPYHDRIRETVLDAMAVEHKVDWHRRFVAALEGSEPLDLDSLSEHALSAGDHAQGGDYARRAARRAAEVFALDRAVALYETALTHLPLSNADRAELLVELAQARAASGRCGEAARTFLQAAALDPAREQELQRRASEQFFINGEVEAGADAMRHALADAGLDYDALTDPAALWPGYLALLERGFDFKPKTAAELDPAQLTRLETLWAAAIGTTWLLGLPTLTIAYVREALEVGEPLQVARGCALLTATFVAVIDPHDARHWLSRLLPLLHRLDTPMTRAWAALCRGAVTLKLGAGDLGLADLRQAEELLGLPENRGMIRELSVCRGFLIMALGESGERTSVAEHVLRYIRLADEAGDGYARMRMRCTFGTALYARYGLDRVRAEIGLGLELAQGLEPPRERIATLISLAVVEAMEGNVEEAHRLVQQTFGRLEGCDWTILRGHFYRACISLVLIQRGIGDRAALLAEIERDAAAVARPLTPDGRPIEYPILAGLREFLQGQLAAATGRRREAIELFEAGVAAARAHRPSPEQNVPVIVGNLRIADLVGGTRGAELRAQSEKGLAALGWDSPRWLALFAARFET